MMPTILPSAMPRLRLFALAALFLCLAATARADVFGRLNIIVRQTDGKPASGANVVLHDTANVREDQSYVSDASGNVLTDPLENRTWRVSTDLVGYKTDVRDVNVASDATTEVDVALERSVTSTGATTVTVRRNTTASDTRRDQNFLNRFPVNAGNPQALNKVVRSTPGFAEDSVNQAHPRGDHSATAIYINGFELPGALQGRAGQILTPDAIQSVDILTGGYAPEYGSETAAILNLNLRSGTITPFTSANVQGGNFSTQYGEVTAGGQAGQALGTSGAAGAVPRRFGYLFNFTGRTTSNALEPPQPDDQTAHNRGRSYSAFGNFDYTAGAKDRFTLTLNDTPATTDVGNRTGLPARFAPYGQGYGYGGALSADQAAQEGIVSQEAAGQDIYQRDNNRFGVLFWRHAFSDRLNGVVSFGSTKSQLDILNHNPFIAINSLPEDSSLEFSPTLLRRSTQNQGQGSLTLAQGPHTYKAGFLYDKQSGNESYNFIPGSQLALDALAAIDPRLAPGGSVLTGEDGNPVLDSQGNPVYNLAPGATVPTLRVRRTGHYDAAYVQDTFRLSRRFTVNYGARFDQYEQEQDLGQSTVKKSQFSPRLNMAYLLGRGTTGRLSYNRLFIQPPLSQGAILGESIQPETLNQYEANVEHAFSPLQTGKIAYYYKDIRNQIDTGLLIPGTQIGAYTSVNLARGGVHGLEFSYDVAPRRNVGLGAYLAYTYSIARPNGLDNTGEQVPTYNDHDQRNTVSTGLSYALQNGALAGVNFTYGSGLASSALEDNGKRTPHTEVDLRLATAPRTGGAAKTGSGLQLDVENVFDQRKIINFNSGFSGTRFQQGRRVLLSLNNQF